MRVIAGQYRSRPLVAPKGWSTRPTSDRLRETLFNIIAPRIAGAIFLDLFAGTGAVGIEAVSRGAEHVYFAETAKPALGALQANLQSLGIRNGCTVDVRGALPLLRRLAERGVQVDFVYLDPPYADASAYTDTLGFLASSSLLHAESIVMVEHSSHADGPAVPAPLVEYRSLVQGDAQLRFYGMHKPAHSADVVVS